MLATLILLVLIGVITRESKQTRRASLLRSPGGWVYDIRELVADHAGHRGPPDYLLRRRVVNDPYRSSNVVWETALNTGGQPTWTEVDARERAFIEAGYERYNG